MVWPHMGLWHGIYCSCRLYLVWCIVVSSGVKRIVLVGTVLAMVSVVIEE